MLGNAEVQNIMKIMGLKLDTKYEDTSRLRYGHIMIMTDQDHDGSHIKGLIVNFFHHFWPSLLEIDNFLQVFITPIVKCVPRTGSKKAKATQTVTFYTTPEYEEWRQEDDAHQDGKKWKIKYYKGRSKVAVWWIEGGGGCVLCCVFVLFFPSTEKHESLLFSSLRVGNIGPHGSERIFFQFGP